MSVYNSDNFMGRSTLTVEKPAASTPKPKKDESDPFLQGYAKPSHSLPETLSESVL